MTVGEFQSAVQSLYRGAGSTPVSGDASWMHRLGILKSAINIWDNQSEFWNELWVETTDTADGGTTYDLPSDFRALGSFVKVSDKFFSVKRPQEIDLYTETDDVVFVTGNKSSGFVLNFLYAPTSGDTIEYSYYKEPDTPTTDADILEMSDPYFAVFFCLGKLHEQEGAGDRARASFSIADEKLAQMILRNNLLPSLQDNRPASGFWGMGL